MTDRDSAFLWETEALRSRPPRLSGAGTSLVEAADWVTLREASDITGVPSKTIRKWARHERIPSFLEKTDEGHLRIVSLEGIRNWSQEIGRPLDDGSVENHGGDEVEEVVVDLSAEPPDSTRDQPQIPEGSMLVPLDAWNKMLNQLGNLHEAGQQLAEARERAAKAETEARFLKERLAEMRAELVRARVNEGAVDASEPAEMEGAADRATTLGSTAASMARRLYESWRERRRS